MAISGYQGFWVNNGDPAGYAFLINKNPRRNGIRRTVNRQSFRVMTELFDTLIGATAGGAALATHKQVAAGPNQPATVGDLGGIRTIETITDINRVSAAADVTALKEMTFNVKTRPTTYPADLSGNGGPSFT